MRFCTTCKVLKHFARASTIGRKYFLKTYIYSQNFTTARGLLSHRQSNYFIRTHAVPLHFSVLHFSHNFFTMQIREKMPFHKRLLQRGKMSEWFKVHAWKACVPKRHRGFESPSFRCPVAMQSKVCKPRQSRNAATVAYFLTCRGLTGLFFSRFFLDDVDCANPLFVTTLSFRPKVAKVN